MPELYRLHPTPKTRPIRLGQLLLVLLMLLSSACSAQTETSLKSNQVTILYSDQPNTDVPYADLSLYYATVLKNLLGGYSGLSVKLQTINEYHATEAWQQLRVFYLGTRFGQKIPEALIIDAASGAPITWIDYGLNDFGPRLDNLGFRYSTTRIADNGVPPVNAFNQIRYHNQIFPKNLGRTEMIEVQVTHPEKVKVQAWAINGENVAIPYALQSGNFWYIADNPFIFTHERDRYVVFADLLGYMLGRTQPCTPKALIRFEDLSPNDNPQVIKSLFDSLERIKIPFTLATIPVYVNAPTNTRITWEERPLMLEQMQRAEAIGGRIFQHGTTHQSDNYPNPSGISAADWEFWDITHNAPLPGMTPESATERVLQGKKILEAVGLHPVGWTTPHYGTDPSYYAGFNTLYNRFFERRQLRIGSVNAGQFFPYPVVDINNSLVLPENLGALTPDGFFSKFLETAKLNLAMRCPWAGMYIHPFLFNQTYGPSGKTTSEALEAFVAEMQKMGYTFVDPLSVEVK